MKKSFNFFAVLLTLCVQTRGLLNRWVTMVLLAALFMLTSGCISSHPCFPRWVKSAEKVYGTISVEFGGESIFLHRDLPNDISVLDIFDVLNAAKLIDKESSPVNSAALVKLTIIGAQGQILSLPYFRGHFIFKGQAYACGEKASILSESIEIPLYDLLQNDLSKLIQKKPELKKLPPPGS